MLAYSAGANDLVHKPQTIYFRYGDHFSIELKARALPTRSSRARSARRCRMLWVWAVHTEHISNHERQTHA